MEPGKKYKIHQDHLSMSVKYIFEENSSSKKKNKPSFRIKNIYILWLNKNISEGKNYNYANTFMTKYLPNIIYNGGTLVTI